MSAKKLRSEPPDVVVMVGSGKKKQKFECHSIILCYASEYFDTILSSSMNESETKQISFPDKDPDEWRLFYSFIEPVSGRNAKLTEVGQRWTGRSGLEFMAIFGGVFCLGIDN